MKALLNLALGAVVCSFLHSCQKDKNIVAETNAVPQEVISGIAALGFSTAGVKLHEEGYLVEDDIVITKEMLSSGTAYQLLRIAGTEQYRTTQLVTGLPRIVTFSVSQTLPARYKTAVDKVASRFNALHLKLRFVRVSSGGNIVFTKSPDAASYLASAGFPTNHGKPYNSVKVNYRYMDGNAWDINSVTTVLAHEVGHCIGFRHTDFADRSYSCGGPLANEGASDIGAIQIPGTPSGPDANSWMLACTDKNVNRPFNVNDVIALKYLY